MIQARYSRSALFAEAKHKKIFSLIERGPFQIVLRTEVGKFSSVLLSSFVFALNFLKDRKELYRTRFVVNGHKDHIRRNTLHQAKLINQFSLRLIFSLASLFGFDVYVMDVTQAYLQSPKIYSKSYMSDRIY